MFDSFTFYLIALACLVAFLCVSVGRRLRDEERRARERQFPGSGFDVSAIAPQIKRLRQDHLAAAHSSPHLAFYRRGLIAAAGRMIADLSFFHRAAPEHETQKH
jgi:hypothetical protein